MPGPERRRGSEARFNRSGAAMWRADHRGLTAIVAPDRFFRLHITWRRCRRHAWRSHPQATCSKEGEGAPALRFVCHAILTLTRRKRQVLREIEALMNAPIYLHKPWAIDTKTAFAGYTGFNAKSLVAAHDGSVAQTYARPHPTQEQPGDHLGRPLYRRQRAPPGVQAVQRGIASQFYQLIGNISRDEPSVRIAARLFPFALP